MSFDFTISISTMMAVAALAAAGIAAWVTIRMTVAAHEKKLESHSGQIAAAGVAAQFSSTRIEEVRKEGVQEMAAFRVEVARTYASNETVRAVKDEVNDGMRQITLRLDQLIDGRVSHGGGR